MSANLAGLAIAAYGFAVIASDGLVVASLHRLLSRNVTLLARQALS